MLNVFTASDYGQLFTQYLQVNAGVIHHPLQSQPLVVPNIKIAKWLSLQLAQAKGIEANVQRILPAQFAWNLVKQITPNLEAYSDFGVEQLQLRIFKLFSDEAFCAQYPRLNQYIENGDDVDTMKLAIKTARIFDNYQLFRQDWLDAWSDGQSLNLGEDELWQQGLWAELVKSSVQPARYQLIEQLIETLAQSPEKLTLPATINVFGISYLPKVSIELFNALAQVVDVNLFAFSPQTEASIEAPQLANWQQIWGVLRDNLAVTAINVDQAMPLQKNKLQRLQVAIKGQRDDQRQESNSNNHADDHSLVLSNCYSPMREVEALHDYLLNRFKHDKILKPADVLVALPDLEKYSPFIRAVFDRDDALLPYQFADNQGANQSALLNGVQTLLEVYQWRFTREQVETLLRNRLVQNKFSLNEDELSQITTWLDQASVRWGVDAAHKTDLDLPADLQNSWREGLDRLLVGYALPVAFSTDLPLFGEHDLLPADQVDSSNYNVLVELINYCELLFTWHQYTQTTKTFVQWQQLLLTLMDDLFAVDDSEQAMHKQILEAINKLCSAAQNSQLDECVDIATFAAALQPYLPEASRSGRLSGAINFAGMNSLAGIPTKITCLLGMNYDAWPTSNREPGFDLIEKFSQLGDRKTGELARYQTLQFLLATQQALYVSYIGHNINTAEEKPASVLVSELSELARQLGIPFDVIEHPMHAYSQNNFQPGLLQSHSQQWLQVSLQLGLGTKSLMELASGYLAGEIKGEISLQALLQFAKNPQNGYLRETLGLSLFDESVQWENSEPFDLANFADSAVRQGVLQCVKNGPNSQSSELIASALKVAQAGGAMPHGMHGQLLHQLQADTLNAQIEAIEENKSLTECDAIPFQLQMQVPLISQLDEVTSLCSGGLTTTLLSLHGLIEDVTEQGFHLVLADRFHNYLQIEVWLKHLILCCVKPAGIALKTQVISQDGVAELGPIEDAELYLSHWLAAMLFGQHFPIEYFHRCSFKYAHAIKKKPKVPEDALKQALTAWADGFNYAGEGSKPANQYLYRDTNPIESEHFEYWSNTLLMPLLTAFEAPIETTFDAKTESK
ncbi:exodeoxyribonuclease V subunit gamma [Psychromonas sp. MME1]|uniref:exodeoxyribonuclease V subunit gamma n=1 Tax=Psychromonas sp. MME1 TaxID=3231032 RepID=UPI0034E2BADC